MAGANKDWDSKVILAKVETTEGTDAAPTTAANALRVLNYQPTFMDADQKVRALEKAFFGADPVAMAAFKRGATFDMELHGSGTANVAPPWMVMLRAAGYGAPVVNGTTSVSQSPVTTGWATVSHYAWIDDLLLIALGCRGGVGFTIEDDEIPRLTFNVLGRPPVALATQSVPAAVTLTGYVDPLLATTEVTTFSLDGFAAPLRRWTMNNNTDLQFRSLIGPADRVNARNRNWNGQAVIEVPDLTAKDYFSKIRPGSFMVGQAIHGTTAGNIVQVDTPRLQITGNVELSEEQGKLMATLPLTALPVSGNDEVVFTSK